MARGPASATAVHIPLGYRRFRLANALGGSGLDSGGSLAIYALLLLKPHREAVGEVDRRREVKEGGGGVSCGAHNTPPQNFPTSRGTNGPAHKPSRTLLRNPLPPLPNPFLPSTPHPIRSPTYTTIPPIPLPIRTGRFEWRKEISRKQKKMISFLPTAKKRDRKSHAAEENGFMIQNFLFSSHGY